MRIKLLVGFPGTFHNIGGGVKPGDVVEVDDFNGARYCKLGYAEPVAETREERAVVTPVEERAVKPEPKPEVVEVPEIKPEPELEPEVEPEVDKDDADAKPRRGRPPVSR